MEPYTSGPASMADERWAMQNPQVRFTYSDYLLLPEQDNRELIDGDFYMVPAPSLKHQRALAKLAFRLSDFVEGKGLGTVVLAPFDVVLSKENVVQPDILYVSRERSSIITESHVNGAPDLVVEVLSPGSAERDRQLKLGLYAKFGVKEYWMVDPEEESVQILGLGARGYDSVRTYTSGKASSALIGGFDIELDRVFAE